VRSIDLFFRPVRLSDAQDINEIRRQKEVRANTLALITETIDFTEGFLKSMGGDDHIRIAELHGKVVGVAGVHLLKNAM
jgi:putative acetyltransferase